MDSLAPIFPPKIIKTMKPTLPADLHDFIDYYERTWTSTLGSTLWLKGTRKKTQWSTFIKWEHYLLLEILVIDCNLILIIFMLHQIITLF